MSFVKRLFQWCLLLGGSGNCLVYNVIVWYIYYTGVTLVIVWYTLQDGRLFFGQVCECDNFQCDRDPVTGLTCGG